MPVEQQITQILASGHGVVRGVGRGFVKSGNSLLRPDIATRLDPLCWDATTSINPAGNLIEFRAVAVGSAGANAVIIGNEADVAACGQIQAPGFLFSDFFSGCLFFLFRDSYGSVYGVHSFRQGGTYPDPRPFFARLGARLLYFFDSAGRFSPLGPDVFGSVICYVSPNKIVIDFFAMHQDGRVVQVVNHTRIDNWIAANGIADPVVGGELAPRAIPTAYQAHPPAAMGLKKRIANYCLNYI